jgi:hypothetical protein
MVIGMLRVCRLLYVGVGPMLLPEPSPPDDGVEPLATELRDAVT